MNGDLAQAWERDILRALQASGALPDSATAGGKFDGYTESWPETALSVRSIRELLDLVETNEVNMENAEP